eukprot:PhM_4_TR10162/c0_g1_i1/m.55515
MPPRKSLNRSLSRGESASRDQSIRDSDAALLLEGVCTLCDAAKAVLDYSADLSLRLKAAAQERDSEKLTCVSRDMSEYITNFVELIHAHESSLVLLQSQSAYKVLQLCQEIEAALKSDFSSKSLILTHLGTDEPDVATRASYIHVLGSSVVLTPCTVSTWQERLAGLKAMVSS